MKQVYTASLEERHCNKCGGDGYNLGALVMGRYKEIPCVTCKGYGKTKHMVEEGLILCIHCFNGTHEMSGRPCKMCKGTGYKLGIK